MKIAISLILTYLVAIVSGGHAILPLGLLLVYGDNASWGGRIVYGWFAICLLLLLSTPQMKRFNDKGAQLVAIIILYSSWMSFASYQEAGGGWFFANAFLSFPFQAAIFLSLSFYAFKFVISKLDRN